MSEITEKFAQALNQLDRIFKRRTGLSGDLIDAAAGHVTPGEYREKVHVFLTALVDDLQALFSDLTGSKCVVTIKLLVQPDEDDDLQIVTAYRDRDSINLRESIYADKEPYAIESHSFINNILTGSPFCDHVAANDLKSLGNTYTNPNPYWHRLFNASAVQAIVSPERQISDSVFGFLCVDNRHGYLDSSMVRKLMSISSTTIFYVLSASSILDDIVQEQANDG